MIVEKKKRLISVCHMTSNHLAKDDRIFYKQCVTLVQNGFDVHLVAFGKSEVVEGVHIHGVGKAPNSRLKRMRNGLLAIYKEAVKLDADIYQLHDPILLFCALKLKHLGKIVIFDSHENYYMQCREKKYLNKMVRLFAAGVYKLIESYVVRRIDAVLVPCTFDGVNIFEGRAKRTVFIPNYPIKREFYDRFINDDAEKSYVCYAGGLSRDRGITQIVKASAKAEVQIVLAGVFTSVEYEESLKKLAEYTNVDYRGFLSRDAICELYSHAIVGCCTLLHNGQYDKFDTLSVKVFEYMAMGIPVILTDYPYARKVLEKYRFGVCVNPEDIDEIAETIRIFRDNSTLRAEMGMEGRKAVSEIFCWDNVIRKLILLYEELLQKRTV